VSDSLILQHPGATTGVIGLKVKRLMRVKQLPNRSSFTLDECVHVFFNNLW
jgi:hypothetical protein